MSFLSLHSISSSNWAFFGCGLSPSYLACVPFFLVFVGWLVLLPCHCTGLAIISLILLPCCYLWAYGLKFLPFHFLHSFPHLGFASQHSYWASPFCALGFLGPFHFVGIFAPFHFLSILDLFDSSLPLSLPRVFAKSFGFPNPIATSLPFGLIGLCANPMNLPIHFLGFPSPFYFLSISYISYGFTTSFLGLPRPICFLPWHLLFLWAY